MNFIQKSELKYVLQMFQYEQVLNFLANASV